MEKFPIEKFYKKIFKDWLDQEIAAGNIERPTFDVYNQTLDVEWINPHIQGIDPLKGIPYEVSKMSFVGKKN